jgi:hypothetical protein
MHWHDRMSGGQQAVDDKPTGPLDDHWQVGGIAVTR